MKLLLLLTAVLIIPIIYAQDSIYIKGTICSAPTNQVLIKQFTIGAKVIAVAPIVKDTFSFKMATNTGIYRFNYGKTQKNEFVDVIIDGTEKEIIFTIDVQKNNLPIFQSSLNNQQWYAYKNQQQSKLSKIEILKQFLNNYPKNDSLYTIVQQQYLVKKQSFLQTKQNFVKQNNNWKGWAVANTYIKLPDNTIFWEGINPTNPKLLNSPLYAELIVQYLQYYLENPNIESLKKSVDTIMKKFSGNEETQKFALEYLTLGFKEIGQEEVLQYLDENYRAKAQCNDESQAKTEFEKRMQGYAAMKVGNQAPNIIFDKNSKLKDLYSIKAEQTLIVFWASWCPHCMQEMPQLNQWAKENPTTKVVAISLDEDQTTYNETIKNYPNFIHYSDLKKWDSQTEKY